MGGSGKSSTKTEVNTKSTPWEGVQPYLKDMYSQLGGLMGQPLEFYPGQTYAPMSDYTSSGMTAATDFLNGPYQQIFNQATGNMSDLSNLMGVANNPYVQGMNETLAKRLQGNARQSIGDFTSSMNKALSGGMYNLNRGLENQQTAYNRIMGDTTENLLENILPGISSQFVADQGFGGSRQALAESESIQDYQKYMRDMASDFATSQGRNYQDLAYGMGNAYSDSARQLQNMISNNQMALAQGVADTNLGAYGQGIDAKVAASQMAPQLMQMGMLPSQTYMNMGNISEGYQQKGIDEAMNRFDFYQNEPWQRLANANAIYSGATPYAGSSSTQKVPSYSNPWATAGALGMGAYGLYNMV